MPLNEVVENFFDAAKAATSGYASVDYEEDGFEEASLVRLSILVNGEEVPALATICHSGSAHERGKETCARLKEAVSRQLYDVAIQAKAGGRVIARETLKAMRKDVTAKCYGGDVSRKKKLLSKQREGKKRMRMMGSVEVPKEVRGRRSPPVRAAADTRRIGVSVADAQVRGCY